MTKYLDFEGLKHFKKKIDAEYKPALNGKADNEIGIFTTGVATPELHVNSNNADEIVLHRVGHAYANTIYLRTRESLESETNPYTKLQISANTTLKQHTYKFKFKRIC